MQRNNQNKTVLLAVFLTFFVSGFSFAQQKTPEISGRWHSNIRLVYDISVTRNLFTWRVESTGKTARGAIAGHSVRATWQGQRGEQSATGMVTKVNKQGRALRIEWSNGVIFTRQPFLSQDQPEKKGIQAFKPHEPGFIDISGRWHTNFGPKCQISQKGDNFQWRIESSNESGPGLIEGETLHSRWLTDAGEVPIHSILVEKDPSGRAVLIEWSIGLVFSREPFPEQAPHPREERPQKRSEREEEIPKEDFQQQEVRPQESIRISGLWNSTIRRNYTITQRGNKFTWTVQGTNEQAEGRIDGEIIHAEWRGEFGTGHSEGHIIAIDQSGNATKIEWTNGVVFSRKAPGPERVASKDVKIHSRDQEVTLPEIKQVVTGKMLVKLIPHLSLKKVYNQWVKVGGPIGGLGYDVRYLSNSPRGLKVMFVTDNYSGVNKSVDGGENWFASNKGIHARTGISSDAIPVFSLTVDPNNPNIVWAGLKDVKGIYKSTNAGTSWKDVTPHIKESEFVFRGFTIMPGKSNIVFAAGELPTGIDGKTFGKVKGRVYVTRNGGKSWHKVWEGNDLARYILIHPRNHKIIYVSCGIFDREAFNSNCKSPTLKENNLQISWKHRGGVGVLRSKDGGRRWQELNRKNGLTDLYVGSLVMHPTNPDILLAGCGNNAASPYFIGKKPHLTGGVFRTTNGGDTWQHVLKNEVITSVEFSPSNPNIAYAGGRPRFFKSEDSGKTWYVVAGKTYPWGPPGVIAGFPIDVLVHPYNPDIIFANNYGGGNVKSSDGGRNWILASQGYTGALMFDLSIHPTNYDFLYATARSGLFRTRSAGLDWQGLSKKPAHFPECYSVAVHPKKPRIVLASQELTGVIYRSTNGGNTWRVVHKLKVVPGTNETHGFKRIVFAPSNPYVVYGASCRGSNALGKNKTSHGIYRSDHAGAAKTWQPANDFQTRFRSVNDLAVHPKNHCLVYAGTVGGGLFRTFNCGKNWSPIKQFQHKDVRSVAINPVNPNIVYAGLEAGGVYRSNDNGNTWHKMMAGMDAKESVWALLVDPQNPNAVWAGTRRSGVFMWDSIEQQWIKVNKGLSTKAIADLEISKNGMILYAATSGEGVFRYQKRPVSH